MLFVLAFAQLTYRKILRDIEACCWICLGISPVIHISDGKLHDANVLDLMIPEPAAIYIMDCVYLVTKRAHFLSPGPKQISAMYILLKNLSYYLPSYFLCGCLLDGLHFRRNLNLRGLYSPQLAANWQKPEQSDELIQIPRFRVKRENRAFSERACPGDVYLIDKDYYLCPF